MRRPTCLLLAVTCLPVLLGAAPADETPLAALPYTPSLDLRSMDRAVDPCVDFYGYACGGWLKNNPIPADKSRWSVYGKLAQESARYLWGLLDEAARAGVNRQTPDLTPGGEPWRRRAGDYFAACMDTAAVEKAGLSPLRADLAAIDGMTSILDLPPLLGRLHLASATDRLLFGFGSQVGFDDPTRYVALADAGGLGLPDRDYYVKEDEPTRAVREAYRQHVARMLQLTGTSAAQARVLAPAIVAFETRLAQASLTLVERRDPRRLDNRLALRALQALTPSFSWRAYLQASGVTPPDTVTVTEPAFLAALDAQLAALPLPVLKAYLRWHVASTRSDYLGSALAAETFAFYGKRLRGTEVMPARWERCVGYADRDLGDDVSRLFVEKVFAPTTKESTLRMAQRVQDAMGRHIDALPWMSGTTKVRAREKLLLMRNKIGYPERWRDYTGLVITRSELAGNVERSLAFESRRQLSRIGGPVDRDEWGMTASTVNAYYDAGRNDMNFPAAVLLPPLFDPRLDEAPSYGNTGATIGHELIHGFDDEGRNFDAQGRLQDWWTPEDEAAFAARTQCVVDQYAQYTVIDDVKLNSRLTLGEDVADIAGTVLAYEAWKDAVKGKDLSPRDGLTPEQRFFVGFGQWACENDRKEALRERALTDPHSPPRHRINGVVVNMPEFAAAFGCRAGQPMVKKLEDVCRVW